MVALGLCCCKGFLQVLQAGVPLLCIAQAPHFSGFSYDGARAPGTGAPVAATWGLGSCGSRVEMLHSIWDLPGPRIELMLPALAGGLSTTTPPGSPSLSFLFCSSLRLL